MNNTNIDVDYVTQNRSDIDESGLNMIRKAIKVAEKYHDGQKRYNGDPYITHPIEVGKILADMGQNATIITAGVLHDTIEDTDLTLQKVSDEFGETIGDLVDGVTKIGNVRYKGFKEKIKSLQKLFIFTSMDPRTMLIKIADRLHNMRTFQDVPEEKKERIALETIYLYAPIAEYIGAVSIKSELENLAFEHMNPKEYKEVHDFIRQKEKVFSKSFEKMKVSTRKKLVLAGLVEFKIEYRVKTPYSIYKKMLRWKYPLEEVIDLFAIRILTETIGDAYKALSVVQSTWLAKDGRFKDYIKNPKPNGYQSLHTSIDIGNGLIVEVQIRNHEMHEKAQFGSVMHGHYKGTKMLSIEEVKRIMSPIYEDKKTWSDYIKDAMSAGYKDEGYSNKIIGESFLAERMFIFTPVGEVVDMSVGSTALDFAYAVHTSLGENMDGAYVNGVFRNKNYKLKNGEVNAADDPENFDIQDKKGEDDLYSFKNFSV